MDDDPFGDIQSLSDALGISAAENSASALLELSVQALLLRLNGPTSG